MLLPQTWKSALGRPCRTRLSQAIDTCGSPLAHTTASMSFFARRFVRGLFMVIGIGRLILQSRPKTCMISESCDGTPATRFHWHESRTPVACTARASSLAVRSPGASTTFLASNEGRRCQSGANGAGM